MTTRTKNMSAYLNFQPITWWLMYKKCSKHRGHSPHEILIRVSLHPVVYWVWRTYFILMLNRVFINDITVNYRLNIKQIWDTMYGERELHILDKFVFQSGKFMKSYTSWKTEHHILGFEFMSELSIFLAVEWALGTSVTLRWNWRLGPTEWSPLFFSLGYRGSLRVKTKNTWWTTNLRYFR